MELFSDEAELSICVFVSTESARYEFSFGGTKRKVVVKSDIQVA